MCGILGLTNIERQELLIKQALETLKCRGRDNQAFIKQNNTIIGHTLHAVVSNIPQPFKGKGILTANCELYNWEEISKTHKIKAKNDSDLLFQLLEADLAFKEVIELLDGVFAFAYYRNNSIYLARDLLGVKPLWYTHEKGFAFASEKKALKNIGLSDIKELNPRQILEYNTKTNTLKFHKRPFFTTTPEITDTKNKIINTLNTRLQKALDKRIPSVKYGLLFSGGLDSATLAMLLKKHKQPFTCYTAVIDHPGFKDPEDLVFAKKAAKELGLKLKIVKITLPKIPSLLKIIVPLIEDTNVVKVSVALTFFKAVQEAKKDGCKVLFSGLGAEELFAGYQRHRDSLKINEECLSGLRKIYERDLYRDDVITMYNSIELRLPFLDKDLSNYALKIPGKLKINKDNEKIILRDAAKSLGLPDFLSSRKKKAAQYGSNVQKALAKLAKENKVSISSYLDSFSPHTNPKLGALISTGKDSIFATYTMMKQNYPIGCMITLNSKNPDSFMFHTPTISLAKSQAESIGLPLIEQETDGDKEHELEDLKKALMKAKEQYGIEGVVTGAILSNYQRDRIEKICDSLSLKIFAPLWHIDQEKYMRDILKNKFKFIITKVAAEGLDRSWLNREITDKDIDKLVELNKKNKINISGEGGEFETLMIDGPIFKKAIKIKKVEIVEENEHTAQIIIKTYK